jgi:dihydroxyacetone kinase-like predicted kinase
MNPSAQDLLAAIEATAAEQVILLPNNKNILMAAEQARTLASKEVLVLPSRSMVQGINALIGLNPEDDVAVNFARMQETMAAVSCGEVTLAVRDSSVNGNAIGKGQFIALAGDEMVVAAPGLEAALEGLLAYLAGPEAELATLYFGAGLAEAEARRLKEHLEGVFPQLDIELHYGGQPVYHFLVSVE